MVDLVAAPRKGIWHWLGFGTCAASLDEENNPGFAPGYFSTETVLVLNWKGRLRVLVSGLVMVSVASKTDVLVKKSVSVSAFSVMPPMKRKR